VHQIAESESFLAIASGEHPDLHILPGIIWWFGASKGDATNATPELMGPNSQTTLFG